jgi:hypothetical protein
MATCVVDSRDGGYAVAGITNSYGAGAEDAWLVKVGLGNDDPTYSKAAGNATGNGNNTSAVKVAMKDGQLMPANDTLK